MTVLKAIGVMFVWLFLMVNAACFAMAVSLWQTEGMFWYGLGLIVSGVATKTVCDWFMRE